ncbi:hypothetical protein RHGRI_009925 [Rhododendron griersonianum]|uniref:Protein kinase domain-containing protein n=1 Tax=Rhododendron griersonianum TaxID=479676 RepID=A0AAV6KGK6_9ERIC|nr:hypothetical protein RHGRI_009925 [Rhododendron griersonianum]
MDFQGNEFKALDNWLHPIPEANNGEREFVGLDLLQRVDIAIDVACALDYLHHQCEMPIIHRDLKPSNILLDGDMVAHVGDFGLARFRAELTTPSTSSSSTIKGTIGYAAPGIALPQRVMEIVDPMLLTEDTDGSKIMENLISLFKIGLACSTESPKDRMDINTALHELHLVKNNILKVSS